MIARGPIKARSSNCDRHSIEARTNEIRSLVAGLTPRDRDVFDRMLCGETAVEGGKVLGVSARTVEMHRVHILAKIGARNAVHLVRMVTIAGF